MPDPTHPSYIIQLNNVMKEFKNYENLDVLILINSWFGIKPMISLLYLKDNSSIQQSLLAYISSRYTGLKQKYCSHLRSYLLSQVQAVWKL